jgi:predicted permease
MRLVRRLRYWWRRRGLARDLAAELEFHRETIEQDFIARGMSPADAHDAARRAMGNETYMREESRAVWIAPWLESVWQDATYAVRGLRARPGFTAVAVLSLGLGIGASTAIFSVIDSLMLRPLPVRDPQALVMPAIREGDKVALLFSYSAFQRLRNTSALFADAAGLFHLDKYNVTVKIPGLQSNLDQDAGMLRAEVVTENYFSMLGVTATRGRTFSPDDDRIPGGHASAVISDGYWQRRFGRDDRAVGSSITIDSAIYTIVGVAPPGFTGEWVGRPVDAWVPLASGVAGVPRDLSDPRATFLQILARLQPTVTVTQASAGAQELLRQIQREGWPSPNPYWARRLAIQHLLITLAATGYSPQRQSFSQPLAVLMTVVGVVLLLACANIANLLLARSVVRSRELSVRVALGAGRGRLIRQLLVENLLLAMAGAVAGLLFAMWGAKLLSAIVSSEPALMRSNASTIPNAISLAVGLDWRIFGFTGALALATGLLFGVAPAVRASKAAVSSGLNPRGAGASGGWRLSKSLVTAQVALCLPLLVVAGLFVGTLRNLKSQDFGFSRDQLLLVWTSTFEAGLGNGSVTPLGVNLAVAARERISRLPGVISASASSFGLMGGLYNNDAVRVTVEGYVPQPGEEDPPFMPFNMVSPGFFSTAGMNLLAGRDFTDADDQTAPRVAIVDDVMAEHFWGKQNPIGRRLRIKNDPGFPVQVVGVVRHAKYYTPRGASGFWMTGMMYLSGLQDRHDVTSALCLVVRTANDSPALRRSIITELRNLDSKLPVLDITSVDQQLDKSLVTERLFSTLSTGFGLLALFLACLGLYGVIAFTVAQRSNEIGIRMALGATSPRVLAMVLRESLSLVGVGIGAGLILSLALTRLVSSWLFGVGATDPVTLVGSTLLLLAVGSTAGFLPARRASRVDPMEALRCE